METSNGVEPLEDSWVEKISRKLEFSSPNSEEAKTLFIFGRNPALSLAELIAMYNSREKSPNFVDLALEGCVVAKNTASEIKLKDMGAVLKKCKIVNFYPDPVNFSNLERDLLAYFKDHVFMDEKSYWSVSAYNQSQNRNWNSTYSEVREIAKDALKELNIRRAFFKKPQNDCQLAPINIQKRDIVNEGFELVLWAHKKGFFLTMTTEVVDVEGYERRDEIRPHRRPLLQIGLALGKTMINLVSVEENRHHLPIYDPFCGVGTIPQEAFLSGFPSMGSDLDEKCVSQSKENAVKILGKIARKRAKKNAKLRKKGKKMLPSALPNFFQMDVTKPNENMIREFTGSVVSEPDLLEPIKGYPTIHKAKKKQQKFLQVYDTYLQGLRSFLKKGQAAVMIFPRVRTNKGDRVSLPIKSLLSTHSFKLCQLHMDSQIAPAVFVHSWKDPIIERIIVVFKRV